MWHQFHTVDDVHDAAAHVVRAMNERLACKRLQLTPEHAFSLRSLLAAALPLVEVEEMDETGASALATSPTTGSV